MKLAGLLLSVVGGDEREQEIARLAARAGAGVRAFGFPVPPGGIEGVEVVASLDDAFRDARVVLLPIPGIARDHSIFAPEYPDPIVVGEDVLRLMAPDGHLVLGAADDALAAAAERAGVRVNGYEHDQELMMLRAPSIVEGALEIAIRETAFSLHGSPTVVVGFGNIGERLAVTLHALGARVTVVARNPVQRAKAFAAGLGIAPLAELDELLPSTTLLFSTVPSSVVTTASIGLLPAGALVMDLAAPPGGIDLAAARARGLTAVWARGLGRRAPITVGASQWNGVRRIIETVIAET
jgi:dipicolinate synthase subunit A